jgi:hypothetical protein
LKRLSDSWYSVVRERIKREVIVDEGEKSCVYISAALSREAWKTSPVDVLGLLEAPDNQSEFE